MTVTQIAMSHDDSLLVSVSRDRSICLFVAAISRGGRAAGGRAVQAAAQAREGARASDLGLRMVTGRRAVRDGLARQDGAVVEVTGAGFECEKVLGKYDCGVTTIDWSPVLDAAGTSLIAIGTEEGQIVILAPSSDDPAAWRETAKLHSVDCHAGSGTDFDGDQARRKADGAHSSSRAGATTLCECLSFQRDECVVGLWGTCQPP
eukprot:CAMPEP_0177743254 /NCGR_PEP_ID=MMETSP0484_2-20121128/29102_1 /TAXON_ID=354590 /ORGANISM="Rhodomonas lens, Strain RHODO" /LENGTH=204 /DNA_ID=CAMNT_0019257653 /DNA_START=26 /DNA_END=639 /DNA_ORIENTATION=-